MVLMEMYNKLLGLRHEGYSELLVFMIGLTLAHEVPFVFLNLCYTVIGMIPFCKRWKIQPEASPTPSLVWHAICHIYIGRTFIQVPVAIVMYYLWRYWGGSMDGPIPPTSQVIIQLWLMLLLMEIMFYSLHRTFHTPFFYKRFHKQHHEFKAPIALSSEYAHPVEDVLVNLTSTLLPAVLPGVHLFVLYIWLAFRTWETVDVHSGYALPFSPFHMLQPSGGPLMHDYHHSHNKGAFGSIGLCDYLLGTDLPYREFLAKKRALAKRSI